MEARRFSAKGIRWFVIETLVIVLGVLIAIGLDDYWNDRQELLLEIDYIQRIHDELERQRQYIDNTWLPARRIKRQSLEAILPVVRGQQSVPDDVVSFLHDVSRGGIGSASVIDTSFDTTIEDLRSTGNLRLIKDSDLRSEIVRYYADLDFEIRRLEGRGTEYVSFVHSVIPAEMRDDIDLGAINDFGLDYALERLRSEEFRNLANQEYNRLLFMESMPPRDIKGLVERLEAYRLELESSLIF